MIFDFGIGPDKAANGSDYSNCPEGYGLYQFHPGSKRGEIDIEEQRRYQPAEKTNRENDALKEANSEPRRHHPQYWGE